VKLRRFTHSTKCY